MTAASSAFPSIMDETQRNFCTLNEKYIRLLAPAGAGKTLALLYRCKYLIEKNPQEKILLFTFTRVARGELLLRLRSNPDFKNCAANITVSTLNSYGHRIIKNKSSLISACKMIEKKERIWAVSNFLIPVVPKSKTLEKKMTDKKWRAFNAGKVMNMLDFFKSFGFDHEALRSESDFNVYWRNLESCGLKLKLGSILEDLKKMGLIKKDNEIYNNFFKFYVAATDHMKSMNLFTLEDQKYWGWKLSEKGSKLTGAARYAHIMIDEFQDINPIDLLFIKAIRNQHDASLTIVGDDDQAIFEWRGATPKYILDPEIYFSSIRYPMKFHTCILNRNYRSPKNIVEMSQRLIRNNIHRVEKNTKPVRMEQAKIFVKTDDGYDTVLSDILTAWNDPSIKNIAVVTRTRSQLIPYQILLASKQVPFFAAEDLNIFLTDAFNSLKDLIEIKQVHKDGHATSFLYYSEAILKLCDRVRKYPLNKNEREMLRNHMCQSEFSSFEVAVDHLYHYPLLGKIFKDDVCQILTKYLQTTTVAEMLEYVGNNFAGLQKDLHRADVDDDIFYTDPPFGELAEFSRRYGDEFDRFYFDVQKAIGTLSALLYHDEDSSSDSMQKSLDTKLHLMTALRTKGKEYDVVFILAANKMVWPFWRASTEEELEAERRLFYVSVTRTRKELHFRVYANNSPSPYLKELGLN